MAHLIKTNLTVEGNISENGSNLEDKYQAKGNYESSFTKNTAFNKNFETSASNIKMNGTAAVGSSSNVARSDHVHPTDTSRASASDLTSHTGNTSNPHSVTKSQIGLGNVDNTADANKNVLSATKLTSAAYIDGVSFDGSSNITHYGTCSTAAATTAKEVSCTGFKLDTGSVVYVRFTVSNTGDGASLTLNVNSTGAKNIKYRNANLSAGTLAANRTYCFIYDGTYYQLIGDLDRNSTYSAGTGLSLNGTTFNHSNSVTAATAQGDDSKTLTFGGTFSIPTVTYDAQGHITSSGTTTMTMPANPNTTYTFATGDSNGQIKVTPSGGTAQNISVKGWGTAATYTATTTLGNDSKLPTGSAIQTYITGLKNIANGIVGLDSDGKISSAQLPSYVDDVIEGYLSSSKFYSTKSGSTYSDEITGESGKIYTDLDTNKIYRWSGTAFTPISETISLGTTSSTAFRGDYGSVAYAHAVTNKGSAFSSGLYKITTNSEGHVTEATAVQKSDITSLLGLTPTANTGTVTKVSTGLGLTGGDITTTGTIKANLKSETALTADSTASGNTANRYYAVAVDKSGYLCVNVPWTDNNTTYSAGTGLSLSGTTINHSNSITAGTAQGDATKTLTFGGTFTIPTVSYDAQGHITGSGTTTMTMPTNPNTDTHYTSHLYVTTSSGTAKTTTALTNGNVYLRLFDNTTVRESYKISGSGATTVTTDTSGNLIISSTNTTYSSLKNPYSLTIDDKEYDGSSSVTVGQTLHYITGANGTNANTKSGSYYAAKWVGTDSSITSLYTGLTIAFKVQVAGNTNYGTVLNINGLGEHPVVVNVSTPVGNKYPVGSIVILTYDGSQSASVYIDNTSTTISGVWKFSEYDSNTITTVRQTLSTSNTNYPLLMAYSNNTTTTENVDNLSYRSNSIYANPSTGTITATAFAGSGASLTSLNASNISSGTVAIGRLPTGTTSSTVALGNHTHSYIPLSGSTSVTGDLGINAVGKGIYLTDSTGFQFPAAYSGTNFFIGSLGTAVQHHTGKTIISSGYDSTNSAGYSTIYVAVPNSDNTNATSYAVLHGGNTSFTPSLTSGTKIGTIKINGTSTDIYCQTNTNTTYSAGTGLSLSSTTFSLSTSGATAGSYGPSAAVTGSNGTTVAIPRITVDAYGRITGITTYNLTCQNTTYTSLKNPNALTVQYNGTSSYTYDGSAAKTLNIKAGSNITVTGDTSGNITIAGTANTTYSAGTGLSLSGTTFNHSNSITAGTAQGDSSKTLTFGGTFTIPTVTYDAQGHITAKGTTTMTMPANPNTDTKVNVTLGTTTKAYLLGVSTTPTSTAQALTTISDTGVYLDTTAGSITATTFNGTLNGHLRSCYYMNSSSSYSSTPWAKIADCTITKTYSTQVINFYVRNTFHNSMTGILTARVKTGSTATMNVASLTWVLAEDNLEPSNFVLVYTNNGTTSVTFEIWCKCTTQNYSYLFTVLSEYEVTGSAINWTLYDSTSGVASYTTGTGTVVSSVNTLKNNGVRSISSGSTNGTISVNTNGTTTEVAVKGLGSNAYTSTGYLPLSGGCMVSSQYPPDINFSYGGTYNGGIGVNTSMYTLMMWGRSYCPIIFEVNGTTSSTYYKPDTHGSKDDFMFTMSRRSDDDDNVELTVDKTVKAYLINRGTASDDSGIIIETTPSGTSYENYRSLLSMHRSISEIRVNGHKGLTVISGHSSISDVCRLGEGFEADGTTSKVAVKNVYGCTVSSGATVVMNSVGLLATSTSSKRYKTNINYDIDTELYHEQLMNLKSVEYEYKDDDDHTTELGMVAEDVADISPISALYEYKAIYEEYDDNSHISEDFKHEKTGNILNYKDRAIIQMLVIEAQRKDEEIKDLQNQIDELKSLINSIIN